MPTSKPKRAGRAPRPDLARPDYPYTMKLRDGRILYVEIPGRWVRTDRDGEIVFAPEANQLLDRVQALATSALDRPPSPGYIVALRQALGLTQKSLGEHLGVDKLTVSRWERGTIRPSPDSLRALEKLRKHAVRTGVTIPA